jgi:PAS domain S-box-containing protein
MLPLSPEVYRQILESMPAGIYIVGLDRRIVFWNRAAEYITGYLAQEVIGRSCGDEILVHCGADGAKVCCTSDCLLTRSLREHKPSEAALYAQHKDGHRVPVRVKSIPIFDEGGSRLFAIAEMFQQEATGGELHWAQPDCDPHGFLNIPSVGATEAYLQTRLRLQQPCGVFLLELLHEEELSRQRGLEMVYALQRAMVQTVADLLASPRFLGRWHHGVLVIVPNCDESSFLEQFQEYQGLSNACSIRWWGDRVSVQVRVRGALSKPDDSMEALFRRIERDGRVEDAS